MAPFRTVIVGTGSLDAPIVLLKGARDVLVQEVVGLGSAFLNRAVLVGFLHRVLGHCEGCAGEVRLMKQSISFREWDVRSVIW